MKVLGLGALEQRLQHDLNIIGYPLNEWVPEKFTKEGERVLDVLIVGAGQGGLAIAFQLMRERVNNVLVIDKAEPGTEGPWINYARMPILRSPKEVNGPDLNIPFPFRLGTKLNLVRLRGRPWGKFQRKCGWTILSGIDVFSNYQWKTGLD